MIQLAPICDTMSTTISLISARLEDYRPKHEAAVEMSACVMRPKLPTELFAMFLCGWRP